jgi:hypothetical protein
MYNRIRDNHNERRVYNRAEPYKYFTIKCPVEGADLAKLCCLNGTGLDGARIIVEVDGVEIYAEGEKYTTTVCGNCIWSVPQEILDSLKLEDGKHEIIVTHDEDNEFGATTEQVTFTITCEGGECSCDEPPQPAGLVPDIENGSVVLCLDSDPKQMVIEGRGGIPGGYVHVLLENQDTGFKVYYPEIDSDENMVDADGNWTVTFYLDANTKNIVEIPAGSYCATFTESDEDGVLYENLGSEACFFIEQCERAKIKFDFEGEETISCEDDVLTISGSGAHAYAEINLEIIYTATGKGMSQAGFYADADGNWSKSFNTKTMGAFFDSACIPSGQYGFFAYQTQYEGFMRESDNVYVEIVGCCTTQSLPLWMVKDPIIPI